MLTVLTLLKVRPSRSGQLHGERAFWREMGPMYLDAWLACVRRYIPQPHRVVVMTDAPEMVAQRLIDGEETAALDSTVDAPGFWAKLNMFREDVSSGKCLYLDLDNVITGDLSELCSLTPDPLVMLDDRRVPRLPNGSAILFDAERCRHIWTEYTAMPRWAESHFVARGDDYSNAYDQAFIARSHTGWASPTPFFQDLLPPDYCLNAYSELPKSSDWRDAHLIFGCGSAKPHTSQHPAFALPIT